MYAGGYWRHSKRSNYAGTHIDQHILMMDADCDNNVFRGGRTFLTQCARGMELNDSFFSRNWETSIDRGLHKLKDIYYIF